VAEEKAKPLGEESQVSRPKGNGIPKRTTPRATKSSTSVLFNKTPEHVIDQESETESRVPPTPLVIAEPPLAFPTPELIEAMVKECAGPGFGIDEGANRIEQWDDCNALPLSDGWDDSSDLVELDLLGQSTIVTPGMPTMACTDAEVERMEYHDLSFEEAVKVLTPKCRPPLPVSALLKSPWSVGRREGERGETRKGKGEEWTRSGSPLVMRGSRGNPFYA
jgi:hypothetical protein